MDTQEMSLDGHADEGWVPWPREVTRSTHGQPADDNTHLLLDVDEDEADRNASLCRPFCGKSLRSFALSEGSLSMECGGEDDAPPAYATTNPSLTITPIDRGRGKARKRNGRGTPSRVDGCPRSLGSRLLKLVRSLGGLAILLLAYTFLGAYVMMRIESPYEDVRRQEVFDARETVAAKLKNNTDALLAGRIDHKEWALRTEYNLVQLELKIHNSGMASSSKKKWTFFGSVLFCVTTYTTIGYGNIAPATKAGRVVTMLYAALGIPLALMVLADLGKHFTAAIKFLWTFVRRFYYTGSCCRPRDVSSVPATAIVMNRENGAASHKQGHKAKRLKQSGKSEGDRGGGCGGGEGCGEVCITVIADGRLTAVDGDGGGDGMSVASSPVDSSMSKSEDLVTPEENGVPPMVGFSLGSGVLAGNSNDSRRLSGRSSGSKTGKGMTDQAELCEECKVPVLVALGFIFAYTVLGAGMYMLWEDWTYLESFYFVFITTTTIGFGDVLPEHPNFFLLSCVYTFLGLAFVSMTATVIMEFMSRTIDHAAELAMAKAKEAKGKLFKVSSRARRRVKKISRAKHKSRRHSAVSDSYSSDTGSFYPEPPPGQAETSCQGQGLGPTGLPQPDPSQTEDVVLPSVNISRDGRDQLALPVKHKVTANSDIEFSEKL